MLRLIIVDDEKITRESLRDYVAWRELDVGSVRTARNGIEALTISADEAPDILLTDVRMPKMDGIVLADRMRTINPNCRIIFLSGYADKHLLKSAIHLRAIEYIEKPVNLDEVRTAVASAVASISADEARFGVLPRDEVGYRATMDLIRDEICRSLVAGEPRGEALLSSYRRQFPPLASGTRLTVAIAALQWCPHVSSEVRSRIRRDVIDACGEVAPFGFSSSFLGYSEEDALVAIVPRPMTKESRQAREAFDNLRERIEAVSKEIDRVAIGVGAPASGRAAVAASYGAARSALDICFYSDDRGIYFPDPGRRQTYLLSDALRVGFQVAIDMLDGDRARRVVEEIAHEAMVAAPVELDSVRNAFFELYLMVHEAAGAGASGATTDASSDDHDRAYLWRKITELDSLSQLSAFLLEYLQATISVLAAQSASPPQVREILRFLHDRFRDQTLNLQMIADHVGLSRTYVSSMFKDATGENLTEYLARIRIEWAKELLKDPRNRAHEVAASVGYADASHFAAFFRRRVGMTPSEYRKSL